MMSENTAAELTANEIQILKNLDEGWEEVWNKIWVELFSNRLPKAIEKSVRQQDRDDCVAFIIDSFRKKLTVGVRQKDGTYKKLFDEFDGKKYNVFQWLCNWKNLHWCICEFRRKNQKHSISILNDTRPKTDKRLGETFADVQQSFSESMENEFEADSDKYADKRRAVAESTQIRLRELLAKITDNPLVLNNQKNDTVPQHAALQLYPHIDNENKKMQTLLELVHKTVSKANVFYTNPMKTILNEHEISDERFDNDIADITKKIDKTNEQRLHSPMPIYELEDELFAAEFKRFFVPLIAEQITRLQNTSRDNAYQLCKRYREALPQLIPPEIKSEWENLQNNELSD